MTDDLIKAWDELNNAIKYMQVSQPARLTAACERLEAAREKFDRLFIKAAIYHGAAHG
jgi:hypothetical protein